MSAENLGLCPDVAGHLDAAGFPDAARALREWRHWSDGEHAQQDRRLALEYWLGWISGAIEVAGALGLPATAVLATAHDALEEELYPQESEEAG